MKHSQYMYNCFPNLSTFIESPLLVGIAETLFSLFRYKCLVGRVSAHFFPIPHVS